jgi:chromosome partitioning protein
MILTVANHKGGVAKTTSAYFLAYAWANAPAQKLQPLLIDVDPQANLTRMCAPAKEQPHIGDVLGGAIAPTATVHQATQSIKLGEGIGHLVPSHITVENVAVGLAQRNLNRLTALQRALAGVDHSAQPVIVDTPPSASILTLNALVAGTHVLICADPEEDAIYGALRISEIIEEIRDARGVGPVLLGVLATRTDTNLTRHKEGLHRLEELHQQGKLPPLIDAIPKRAGQDSERVLREAYAPAAAKILEMAHA